MQRELTATELAMALRSHAAAQSARITKGGTVDISMMSAKEAR